MAHPSKDRSGVVKDSGWTSSLTKGFSVLGRQAVVAASALQNLGPAISGLVTKLATQDDEAVKRQQLAAAMTGPLGMGTINFHASILTGENDIVDLVWHRPPPRMVEIMEYGNVAPRFIPSGTQDGGDVELTVQSPTPEFLTGMLESLSDTQPTPLTLPGTKIELALMVCIVDQRIRIAGATPDVFIKAKVVGVVIEV